MKRIILTVALPLLLAGATGVIAAQQDQQEQSKPATQQTKPNETGPKAQQPKPEQNAEPRPAQPERQQQEQKNDQQEKQQSEQEKHTKQEQQKSEPSQLEEQRRGAQQQEKQTEEQQRHAGEDTRRENEHRPAAMRGTRIPQDRFRAHFGPEHHFRVERVILVENRPRFQYSGYWFELMDPWPADWSYTDDCYVDYIDDEYFLFNPLHPGVRIAVIVVG